MIKRKNNGRNKKRGKFHSQIEFVPFWPFLVCLQPLFEFIFLINGDDGVFLDIDFKLFNTEIVGLYIDGKPI